MNSKVEQPKPSKREGEDKSLEIPSFIEMGNPDDAKVEKTKREYSLEGVEETGEEKDKFDKIENTDQPVNKDEERRPEDLPFLKER